MNLNFSLYDNIYRFDNKIENGSINNIEKTLSINQTKNIYYGSMDNKKSKNNISVNNNKYNTNYLDRMHTINIIPSSSTQIQENNILINNLNESFQNDKCRGDSEDPELNIEEKSLFYHIYNFLIVLKQGHWVNTRWFDNFISKIMKYLFVILFFTIITVFFIGIILFDIFYLHKSNLETSFWKKVYTLIISPEGFINYWHLLLLFSCFTCLIALIFIFLLCSTLVPLEFILNIHRFQSGFLKFQKSQRDDKHVP